MMIVKRPRPAIQSADPFVIQEGRLKYGNFQGKFRRDWVEEAFTPAGRGEETVATALDNAFLRFFRWGLGFLFVVLVIRLGWLQIIKGDYYAAVANGNRLRLERLESGRGIISDRTGLPLVHNVANFLLYCTPSDLPRDLAARDALIDRLATMSPRVNAAETKAALNALKPSQLEFYQPMFIADNLAYENALRIYLESFSMPGIVLSNKSRREYSLPSLSFSHFLGYTGKINEKEYAAADDTYSRIDYVGKSGLEKTWQAELRGIPGTKQIEVDALGKEKNIVGETPSVPGHNITLAIDAQAQTKLEELMAAELKTLGLDRGAAIVMDPNSGEVISLVSLPAFDNNVFARGITQPEYSTLENSPSKPLFNRVVSGEYPAGSTIKPVVAAAALQEKVITENTAFLSTGGLRVGQWSFPDWKAGGHGMTDVRKAIAESVNTFFYYVGGGYGDFQGLGIDRMDAYFRKFLLGSTLGIDLPNEANGFVPTMQWKEDTKKERWYIGDTYHVAIGQGDLIATPLQIAAYTMFFANGGRMYKPHLVKDITDSDGNLVRHIEPEVIAQNLIDPANIQIVREGMRQTAVSGSARSLSALPVSAAGKTGTAQWSTKKAPHAWFTGFAPYDNPQIVITVLVEEGKEGSSAATPIAREFMKWYFTRQKP